jgi:hypothetical protein
MKIRLEATSPKPEPGHNGAGAVRIMFRFSLNRGCPPPLWQQARIQAINFQHDDIERTHWKKVWRSLYEE